MKSFDSHGLPGIYGSLEGYPDIFRLLRFFTFSALVQLLNMARILMRKSFLNQQAFHKVHGNLQFHRNIHQEHC